MNQTRYDLVIIGGGPAGYVAAIRAAQLSMNVACIDENIRFGGTCLRVGCIPSKALLESSHLYHEARHGLASHGIKVSSVQLDLSAMMERKNKIVETLTGGIDLLFKKNKVTAYRGRGTFLDRNTIEVSASDGSQQLIADKIMIAVGSRATSMRGVEEDGDLIGNSTAALKYPEAPRRLVVIGAGYIGLELGSVWNRLGTQVTVLEAMDRVLPGIDGEIATIAQRTLQRQGLDFKFGTYVQSARVESGECMIRIKDSEPVRADRVLLAVGRTPATGDLGLEAIGVTPDRRGYLTVNENFETSATGVHAIGDCIGGAMLAHKAMEEGIICVERMTGMGSHVNYNVIPAVVYTHPEIATVGKTEEQLKEASIEYRKGMCPYGANGRARTLGDIEGRVKILADATTDRVLGVHIIGGRAGDLIAEAATAMEFGASSEDIARCCHAHPTLSETMHEAALAVDGRAIHTA